MRWLLVIFFLVLRGEVSFANIISYDYQPGAVIKSWLSSDSINRIEFSGQSVSEVIGDEAKYQLITDKQGKNIFILPKVLSGESFNISLISTSGLVQDMQLTAGNIEGQSILIEFSSQEGKALEHKDVADMLRSMKSGRKGKYYVQEHNIKIATDLIGELVADSNPANIEVFKKKTYRFNEFMGVVLSVRNKGKTSILLSEEDFSKVFTGTIATNIESNLLGPGSKGLVLIVTKERNDD
jgi:ribosomal protein L19